MDVKVGKETTATSSSKMNRARQKLYLAVPRLAAVVHSGLTQRIDLDIRRSSSAPRLSFVDPYGLRISDELLKELFYSRECSLYHKSRRQDNDFMTDGRNTIHINITRFL